MEYYNTHTKLQAGNIKIEMVRLNVNILRISEVWWPGAGEQYLNIESFTLGNRNMKEGLTSF